MSIDLEQIKTEKQQKRQKLADKMAALISGDPQLQKMSVEPEGGRLFKDENAPLEKAIDHIFVTYAERNALATRAHNVVQDAQGNHVREYLPKYNYITYQGFQQAIHRVANAWRHDARLEVKPDDYVCLIGFASTQFLAIDTACHFAHAIPVPLQSTTSGADIDEIFANVNPSAVAATLEDIEMAAEHVAKHGDIAQLIVFDYDERVDAERDRVAAAKKTLEDAGVKTLLITYDQLLEAGSGYSFEFLPEHNIPLTDRTALVLHSSGSTGKPKGALISEYALKKWWNPLNDKVPAITVCFAPLNHGMGRMSVIACVRKGTTCYFTLKPDMSSLFEDIRLARPMYLGFFPRVFDLIYQHFQNEVANLVRQGTSQEDAETKIKAEMKTTFLGDRLCTGLVGSAPSAQKVRDFVVDCFDIFLEDGYGNTEAGAGSVTRDNQIERETVIDYKLVDVPELGYYTTDKPYPRGELCFKTKAQIRGYLNDPEATANLIDEEGFILSGDIVEERGPDYVVIIDRRKDVLKLAQGEYVAVGPLAAVYEAGSALIKQMYVYGNSKRAYVLAVVVPEEEAVITRFGEYPDDASLKNVLRDEMQIVAEKNDIKSFEVPRDFIIEQEAFSQENGLLSSVRKRLRPALERKYGERLEAMYAEHEQRMRDEYEALKSSAASNLSTEEKLCKIAEVVLGIEGIDPNEDKTFNELGGDSIGAMNFSLSIEDIFGVSVGADVLLSPTGNIKQWASDIEALLNNSSDVVSFSDVHGADSEILKLSDLSLEKFIPESILDQASELPAPGPNTNTVLITGANGFLGRHTCLQWMQRLQSTGGKVICIVRAADDEKARERLQAMYAEGDGELEKDFSKLAEQHLEVLAGDIGKPLLGLSADQFDALADKVDRIVHVAALVNHRLSYRDLFAPNVVGTADLIRLALQTRKKVIDFVSTAAVLGLLDHGASSNNEEAPLLKEVPLDSGRHAGGYATSKWAGEYLVQQANERFQLPVNILRGNWMLAHQRYSEQINYTDSVARLMYSIMLTGIAPSSFYAQSASGESLAQSLNGIPVDLVAASVIAAANHDHCECRTFNLDYFHHDDGFTWDAIVRWIESAGYAIDYIADYDLWLERFREKLKALPETQRQRSALEILAAYAKPQNATEGLSVDNDNFKSLVASILNENQTSQDGGIPHLNEDYLHKCVRDIESRYFDGNEKGAKIDEAVQQAS